MREKIKAMGSILGYVLFCSPGSCPAIPIEIQKDHTGVIIYKEEPGMLYSRTPQEVVFTCSSSGEARCAFMSLRTR